MVGAIAQLLSELDVDVTTQDFITENLEQRGIPVGSGERLRNALLRYYGVLLDRARREQKREHRKLHCPRRPPNMPQKLTIVV